MRSAEHGNAGLSLKVGALAIREAAGCRGEPAVDRLAVGGGFTRGATESETLQSAKFGAAPV